ncbi:transcriptional activator RfaH [Aurantimonas sp. A2-1-M11]|uniref:transcription termination/antitermination protein NusG n=1 Tax=Aurantimonas sp. A2-1-M11 TaxID=3113712 RepID=UPI002F921677
MIADTPRRWYAVATQPGRETLAKAHLERQDFDCVLPMQERTVRHARRVSTTRASFFPGYLFVALDLSVDRWRSVNGTVGVRHIISAGDRPVAVPRGMVETLQAAMDEAGLIRIETHGSKGDKVTLHKGPFTGMVGEWDRMQGSQRVRVLLNLLNGQVPVVVETGSFLLIAR